MKKGAKGSAVKELQILLKSAGFFNGKVDGDFGNYTHKKVVEFQKSKGLTADGIAGKRTLRHLVTIDTDRTGVIQKDTDGKVERLGSYTAENGLLIDKAYLDTDEFVMDYGKVEPVNLIIHHTAGWNNPYSTVSSWNRDKRGRVATQYVIGGTNLKTGDNEHDGIVVETFPNNYLGWHMGKVGNFERVSKLSVGIEVCNFGYLDKKGDKYFTYVGTEVSEDMVYDLGEEFRGHRYWHKYTDKQIESLRQLIEHITKIYPKINIENGIPRLLNEGVSPIDAFGYNEDANYGRELGLWSHSNCRKDKYDMYPQYELVEMLRNLIN
jgi:N-acetyl-anhydromuramyl-L-alanine amidase AmpD